MRTYCPVQPLTLFASGFWSLKLGSEARLASLARALTASGCRMATIRLSEPRRLFDGIVVVATAATAAAARLIEPSVLVASVRRRNATGRKILCCGTQNVASLSRPAGVDCSVPLRLVPAVGCAPRYTNQARSPSSLCSRARVSPRTCSTTANWPTKQMSFVQTN